MTSSWIRLGATFPESPTADLLASLLDDREAWVYVVRLWCWASKADLDDLGQIKSDIIALRAGAHVDGDAFVHALQQAGVLTNDKKIVGFDSIARYGRKKSATPTNKELPPLDEALAKHGDYLRDRYPAYDGQNGRPTIRELAEEAWAWDKTQPRAKRKSDAKRFLTNWLRRDYQRTRWAYERDRKSGEVYSAPSVAGGGKKLSADEREALRQERIRQNKNRRKKK